MVQLPTRDDLGGLPSARSGRTIANYDTSAAGRGLAQAGESIASAAATVGKLAASASSGGGGGASQAEKFETNRRFLEFTSAQRQAYEDSKSTVDPGAFGFREQAQKRYLDSAKEFFKTIPNSLKGEYDAKLFAEEDDFLNKSRAFETAERTRYYGDEINKGLTTIESGLFSNPGDFDKGFNQGVEYINSIPDESLSRIQKADLVKQWRSKAQLASLNGVTPQERIRLLGGVSPVERQPSASRAQSVTRGISGNIRQIVSDAATRYGQSPEDLLTIVWLESKGDPTADNPKSSAGGLLQFIDSTAIAYGLQNKFDPAQSADAGARLLRDNSIALERVLGRKPTTGELYLAHQQGIGGATKLLGNPNARAVDVVGADAVRLNGGSSDMTAGEFASLWLKKAGDTHVPDGGIMNAQFDASRADPRFADMNYLEAQKIIEGSQVEIRKQDDDLKANTRAQIEIASANAPVAILNSGNYDGELPTAEQFIQAYGEDGAAKYNKFKAEVETSQQAFNMQTMPEAEINQLLSNAKPTASGDTAALETAKYDTLTKAAQQIIKAREADPAAYVQTAFPNVAQAWEQAESSGDYRTALAATASAQQMLGIRDMRLLPKNVADQTITQFKDETVAGQERINAVTGIVFSTSDPAQRQAIFNQLVDAGLPEATEGALDAYARGDEGAGRRLMEAAIIDTSKLPGTTNLKPADIDAEIQAKIMDEGQIGDIFYGLSDGTVENQERAIRDSKLLTNAVNIRVRNGETLEAAIDGAAKDLYGDVQAVTGDMDVNAQILVPKDVDPAHVLAGLAGLLPTVRSSLEGSMAVNKPTAGPTGVIKGQVESGNIDLEARPQVKNADGSISTVRSMSFEDDGVEVVVPTVSPDGRIMSDEEAIEHYRKTGQHLGKFDNPEDATAFAENLHAAQEKFYSGRAKGEIAIAGAVTSNYIDNVLAEGYFRNAGDGYVFIDPFVGAAIADKAGNPIVFTDADVSAAPRKEKPKAIFDDMPQTQIQTPEQVQESEYGKFAPMLNEMGN